MTLGECFRKWVAPSVASPYPDLFGLNQLEDGTRR